MFLMFQVKLVADEMRQVALRGSSSAVFKYVSCYGRPSASVSSAAADNQRVNAAGSRCSNGCRPNGKQLASSFQ